MAIAVTIAETIIDTGVIIGTTVVTLDYPGPQGPQGDTGVVSVTSPVTNTGTAGSANIGLNQSLLSLAREQIIGTAVTTIAGKALTAGTADYATIAGSATTAGSADATPVLRQYVKAGTGITKGQAVYVTSSSGTNVIVGLAQANSEVTSSKTLGLVTSTLAANDFGYVVTDGTVTGLNTASATAGDPVWLSPSTPGGLLFGVANKPVAPNMLVYIGVVVRAHATLGEILVHVQNGFEVEELHNVLIASPATGQTLVYDSATSLWANGNPQYATTAGTSTYATTAGTSTYATTAGTSTYATTAGTSTGLSGSINPSQVVGTAAILGANTFTGKQTLPASTVSAASLRLVDGTAPTSPATGDMWAASGSLIYQSSLGAQTLAFLSSNITGTSAGITGSITASQVAGTAAVLTSANTFTVGGHAIKTGGDSTAGAAIWRNSATQSAALFTLYQSNGSSKLAEFDAKGALALTPDSGTALTVNGASTSAVQMIVKGAVSQTANLQEWQTSAATVATVSSSGQFTISPSSGTALTVNAASGVGLFVKADAGSNDIFQAQINSAATNRFIINTTGRTAIGSPATVFSNAFLSVSSVFTTNPAIVARAVASQTANIQEWQDSAGTVLAKVDANGYVKGSQIRTMNDLGLIGEQNTGSYLTLYTMGTTTPNNPGAGYGRMYLKTGTNANTLKLCIRAGTAGAETTILDNIPTA